MSPLWRELWACTDPLNAAGVPWAGILPRYLALLPCTAGDALICPAGTSLGGALWPSRAHVYKAQTPTAGVVFHDRPSMQTPPSVTGFMLV